MTLNIEEIKIDGYERVVHAQVPEVGLSAIVAIHNTNLGPACGGIRLLPYQSKDEALRDVLRLSKGMSYKSALAGISFGGGKSVIIQDPSKKDPALFQAFGEFVASFGGKYIAAKDMNTTSEDLIEVKKKTLHVLGIDGMEKSSGDPSPVTARGVYRALEATVEFLNGTRSLSGVRVAIQGLGHVGYSLAERVHEGGGEIWVTDVDPRRVQKAEAELGAHPVARDAIYDVECDIFSPCAIGAILNADTVERLRCRAVVGAANNQLATPQDGLRLHERGIVYAPDYAVNSGGIINVYQEFEGYDSAKALDKADHIYDTVAEILRRAKDQGIAPFVVADQLAEERLYGLH
ncbi:MAG: amino acid dehydrogenase [Bdellovibrionales bacterium]|nr:amino acid dehydrogenase [Bdellovibrionales bacterium]